MFKAHAVLMVALVLSLGQTALCTDDKGPWHLSDVIKRASDHVTDKDTSVQNARLELQMLEALSKTRVELRPQISILSFSNPIFLAASLGSSLSINHRTAPSPLNMELARFAVVEAEVNRAQARINSRINTSAQFFALAESQDLAARACRSWNNRTRDRGKVQSFVSMNRITRLDVIRFEQDVTGLESECVEAKSQMQLAAIALARLVGLDGTPEQLQVSTADLSEVNANDLPTSNELILAAVESQNEFNVINHQMAQLATAGTKRKFHFDSFSVGYAYLKNIEQKYPDMGKQYLLGGNVGHIDGGFYLPLRNTGDEKATYNFLQARFDRVQNELKDLKLTVRFEIEDNVQRATLAAARLRLSQKKEQLANELHALTAERRDVGLQPAADELWAARDAERAEADTARSELEWKRTAFTALALSHPESLNSFSLAKTEQSPGANASKPAQVKLDDSNGLTNQRNYPERSRIATVALDTPIAPQPLLHPVLLAIPPVVMNQVTVNATALNQTSSPVAPAVVQHQPQALAAYLPARPLNRVLPNYNSPDATIIYTTADINVTVSIDQEGRVTDARVPNPPPNMNTALVGNAITAAKSWRFEPAKLHGRNIPSDHTITFRFRPKSLLNPEP